jgi:hypothetical protein
MWLTRLLGKDGTSQLQIGSTHNAAAVQHRPLDYGSSGSYRLAVRTGTLAAALAANAVIFSARWGDATKMCIIHKLVARVLPLTPFTAATLTDHTSLDMIVARGFTASDTGGTGVTLTGNNQKMRTNMATSSFTDMRISSTAALSTGTRTLDAQAIAGMIRKGNRVNPAAATEEVIMPTDNSLIYAPDVAAGEHPLTLVQNEGFLVRNVTVWPAAGTAVVAIELSWTELDTTSAY